MGYARILLGTDLSDASLMAAHAATRVAKTGGAALVRVVHVAPLADVPERVSAARDATDLPRRLAAWCARAGVATREPTVLYGEPAVEIAREAEAFGADLVVVADRGRGRLDRLLLGSTARSLVRAATMDTLVARGQDTGDGPLQHVLVATDLYEPSARAAKRARSLADASGAALSIVYAIDPAIVRQAARTTPGEDFPGADEWLRGTYDHLLAEFAEKHLGTGRAATRLAAPGSAPRVVAEQARALDADLVVIGTHGARHGLQRLLLGAHAESIVEHAPCSVLVVR